MLKRILSAMLIVLSSYAFSQETYYNGLDLNLTGIALKNILATRIINTHTNSLSYSNIWDASMVTDVNPANSGEVLLIYGYSATGQTARTRGINMNGGSVGDWNREHVFSNSLAVPDLDNSGDDGPPYADAHNLRPCDTQTNSSRGNRKFSDDTGNSGATTESYTDFNGNNAVGWYPGDEWKGDVARMMMYMYLRYGDQCKPTFVGLGDSSATPDDMIDLFLQWNVEDPVSDFEKGRNTYHENTSNTYAQGNRNPFIDNPRLATRIWGGPEAEDLWGIYTTTDTEAPTVPTNVSVSNETTFSLDVSWTASTDNVAVTSYDIYVDGNIYTAVSSTSTTLTGLDSNTTYAIRVSAKDVANNASAQSTSVNGTTLEDTQPPTAPTNVTVSNETDTTFMITWTASTDNTAVTGYDIYLDGNLNGSTTTATTYDVSGLTASTTYVITIKAKDAVNNQSTASTPVNGTTNVSSSGNELFISEYIEGSGFNKAIEIANITGNSIDLSMYNLRRQSGGSGAWSTRYDLSGTLVSGDVVVVINGAATDATILAEADITVANNGTPPFGEPLNFNGDDPVGLFKDDALIDIVGVFNSGGGNFAKDKTLRRKSSVSGPNTTYDFANEWDEYPINTVDDLGSHTTTASVGDNLFNSFKMYPNPVTGNTLYISSKELLKITVYNLVGIKLLEDSISEINNTLDISSLTNGVYILNVKNSSTSVAKKFIKL
ncbi:MAG: endonuclease [Flavobacteriaceae bacterium]